MGGNFVFQFSLLLILIASSSSSSNSRIEFDSYELVIQWDPATCSDTTLTQPCSELPHDKFSIRGLWPAKLSPFQIIGPCIGTRFNPEYIEPINFALNQYWPDVKFGNNEQVWRDEWTRHGTCSEQYLDQLDYFSFALNSFNRHNLFSILSKNHIRPDDFYRRDRVEETISRAIGVRPALHCNINNLYQTQQLHQIRLCYSKNSKTLRNCSSTSSTCGHTINWYPYMRKLYGYFPVSFQWEPATCFNHDRSRECVQNPGIRFSINGVWPITRRGLMLGPCNGSNFDVNQVSPILVRLNRIWPDLFSRRNEQLWENEWRNHGTCSEDQFGQLQYFSLGVHAYEAYDILSILRSYNITPNGQIYRRENIENAIRLSSVAARPYVMCNRAPNTERPTFQLHEIILCYDDYGRRTVDCSENQWSLGRLRCPATFNWFI